MDKNLRKEDEGSVNMSNFNNRPVNIFNSIKNPLPQSASENPVLEILIAEGCENFVRYIEWLGLDNDPTIVVLPSERNYFYGSDEMKCVNTVISLKELNRIRESKDFLRRVFQNLPQKSNFLGCFIDNNRINAYSLNYNLSVYQKRRSANAIENGIISEIPFLNRLYSLMDSRTYKYFSSMSVTLLLEELGFKVLDMTEFNGLTYFHSQKDRDITEN